MKTIYKYQIEIKDFQTVDIPPHGEILTVKIQNGYPHIWVEVDTDATPIARHIMIVGTGHPIENPDKRYIGTIQDEIYVWHVFEITP